MATTTYKVGDSVVLNQFGESKLKVLFQKIRDNTFICDSDRDCIWCSERYSRHMGLDDIFVILCDDTVVKLLLGGKG